MVTKGGYTKHGGQTAGQSQAAEHSLSKTLSRNGEDSRTQIGKALGSEKGSPQAGRTDAWAEMPCAVRLL